MAGGERRPRGKVMSNDPSQDGAEPTTAEPSGEGGAERTRPRERRDSAHSQPAFAPEPSHFELGDVSAAAAVDRPAPRGRSGGLVPWLLLVLVLALAAGFVVRWYLPLGEQLRTTLQELEATRQNVAILQQQIAVLESSQAELNAKVAAREQEVNAMQKTQEELAQRLEKEIRAGDVAISQARGQLVVDLVDKILFPQGEAEVNDQGKEVLRQVGETLLKVPDKLIQVTGHTDNVKISEKLRERFPTNWELSSQRATNVVRFLQEEIKVPGERLAIVGRSEYQPIASNNTKSGRKRNRRIEVTLMPVVH